jgi:hypothetical protein
VILDSDLVEMQHEHIEQAGRYSQAHAAEQEKYEHRPGPLIRCQDQVDHKQLGVHRSKAGQPEERRIHACAGGDGDALQQRHVPVSAGPVENALSGPAPPAGRPQPAHRDTQVMAVAALQAFRTYFDGRVPAR